jgi:hypothetical protein
MTPRHLPVARLAHRLTWQLLFEVVAVLLAVAVFSCVWSSEFLL